MRKKLSLSLIVLCVCGSVFLSLKGASSFSAQQQVGTNLLQNGDFEAGPVGLGVTSLPGWRVVRANVDVIPNNVQVLWAWHQSADGTKSLELTA